MLPSTIPHMYLPAPIPLFTPNLTCSHFIIPLSRPYHALAVTHIKDGNPMLPATELTPSQRLSLWSALVFLQTVLPGNDKALMMAAECGMHRALGPLVKLIACWAAIPASSGNPFLPPTSLLLTLTLTLTLSLTLIPPLWTITIHPVHTPTRLISYQQPSPPQPSPPHIFTTFPTGAAASSLMPGAVQGRGGRYHWMGGWAPSQAQLAGAVLGGCCSFTYISSSSSSSCSGSGEESGEAAGVRNKRLLAAAVGESEDANKNHTLLLLIFIPIHLLLHPLPLL